MTGMSGNMPRKTAIRKHHTAGSTSASCNGKRSLCNVSIFTIARFYFRLQPGSNPYSEWIALLYRFQHVDKHFTLWNLPLKKGKICSPVLVIPSVSCVKLHRRDRITRIVKKSGKIFPFENLYWFCISNVFVYILGSISSVADCFFLSIYWQFSGNMIY